MTMIGGPGRNPLNDGRQSDAALAIARGTQRMLAERSMASLTEHTLASGRRADIIALSGNGEIWIVEIKSSLADYLADAKWSGYREYCDRLWFAVAPTFPAEVLPGEVGLIIADRYGAEIVRTAPEHRVAGSRRKAVTITFARSAAQRLLTLADPESPLDADR